MFLQKGFNLVETTVFSRILCVRTRDQFMFFFKEATSSCMYPI